MQYELGNYSAAEAPVDARAAFITRTYLHLLGAIVLFCVLEATWFASGLAVPMLNLLVTGGRFGWLLVLGGFMGVSMLAERWANSDASPAIQYAGLGFYVLAESLIFVPMIAFAIAATGDLSLLGEAGLITLVLFGGLTGVVFLTRKDFSFLRGILLFAGIAGLVFIAASAIFGFSLGLVFSWAMLVLACGYILYHTSNVMLHYRPDQYVAASLALFASVALLFWYVLRILLSRRD